MTIQADSYIKDAKASIYMWLYNTINSKLTSDEDIIYDQDLDNDYVNPTVVIRAALISNETVGIGNIGCSGNCRAMRNSWIINIACIVVEGQKSSGGMVYDRAYIDEFCGKIYSEIRGIKSVPFYSFETAATPDEMSNKFKMEPNSFGMMDLNLSNNNIKVRSITFVLRHMESY